MKPLGTKKAVMATVRRPWVVLAHAGLLGLLSACGGGGGDASLPTMVQDERAEVAVASVQSSQEIAGQYIVTLHADQVDDVAQAIHALLNIRQDQVIGRFDSALKGFVVQLPASAAEALRQHPAVQSIELDRAVHVASLESQTNAPYWLDRIDQFLTPLDDTYDYEQTGAGVRAYVVDTGIRASHQELGGRVLEGFSLIEDGLGTGDCNGHGTHVSSLLGGQTYGVAKQVSFVPVRVFDCRGNGTWSDVIAGLDWVRTNLVKPAVVGVSISGPGSAALDTAIRSLIAEGATVVVAAGNNSSDGCLFSPARVGEAISVGASNRTDGRANFSNFGSCIDIFAPGEQMEAAHHLSDTALFTRSGTSQAVPLVAGVAANLLQRFPNASPAAVANFIQITGSLDRLSDPGANSPNLLLFSRGEGEPFEPAPQEVAISSITGTPIDFGAGWAVETRVSAYDLATRAPAAGLTVTVVYSLGEFQRCTTQTNGSCSVVSANMDNYTTSTVASVPVAVGKFSTYRREFNVMSSQRVYR